MTNDGNGNIGCAGVTCDEACAGGNCNLQCDQGGDCQFDCQDGGCMTACDQMANCHTDCPMGGCAVECDEPGTTCSVTCGGDAPCEVTCLDSAVATCEGDNCQLTGC